MESTSKRHTHKLLVVKEEETESAASSKKGKCPQSTTTKEIEKEKHTNPKAN
jgi:hypothetical protein